MLVVHHLGLSQSERIVWLCEELGIDYELKIYTRDNGMGMAPPAYKALHSQGTAPIITDGDITLPESGAIAEYIIHKHGGGRLAIGPDAANYSDYLYWLHFANSTFMGSQMLEMMLRFAGEGAAAMAGFMSARSQTHWSMVEVRLGETPYLAGSEFSAADIMTVFPLTTLRAFMPRDLEPYPNIGAYLQRIGARPAYQRAMAKGDPTLTPLLS